MGNTTDPNLKAFQKTVSRVFIPNKLVILVKVDDFISNRNSVIKEMAAQHDPATTATTAYICEQNNCGLPIYTIEQLKQTLSI